MLIGRPRHIAAIPPRSTAGGTARRSVTTPILLRCPKNVAVLCGFSYGRRYRFGLFLLQLKENMIEAGKK